MHYGPGALGGAVSVEPRWFALPYASASYANGGDEFVLAAGFGSDTFFTALPAEILIQTVGFLRLCAA